MNLLGFGVSFAFLMVACLFGIVSIATNSWWTNKDYKFKAGLWQQCYESTPCIDYSRVFDRSMKKLFNATDHWKGTKGQLQNEEFHLNVVRGLAVFSFITTAVSTLVIGLFIYSIKTNTTKYISLWLQCVVTVIILIAGITGLVSALHGTNYKKIFGAHLNKMKLGGSWVCLLIESVFGVFIGVLIPITLLYNHIKAKRTQEEQNYEATSKTSSRKSSSRKSSTDVVENTNFTAHHHHPYSQYYAGENGASKDNEGVDGLDENENDYTIPAFDEVMRSYEDLNDDGDNAQTPNLEAMGGKLSYTESDYTLAQLSDYSSQPMADLNSDFTIDQERSASFSNQLYEDVN